MYKLTDSFIKKHVAKVDREMALGTNTSVKSLADGMGLTLKRMPSGKWAWLYRFRLNGKANTQSFGIYPEVSLAQARERLKESRSAVAVGDNPVLVKKERIRKKQDEYANTFYAIAKAWHGSWSIGRNADHAKKTWGRLEKDVLPVIGAMPIESINLRHLTPMLKKLESRSFSLADKMRTACSQVFRYACAGGILQFNPLASVEKLDLLCGGRPVKHMPFVSIKEVPQLLLAIDSQQSAVVRLGLLLIALTFVRHGELRSAEWKDIDFEEKLWTIPANKMKQVNGGATDHLVPLSRQALNILQELKKINGHSKFLFPSIKGEGKFMSDGTLNKALKVMGYHGRQTVHGFRSIASTLLHENGFDHQQIELQLAHLERNKVSAAYNHATYLKQRTKMMQDYADLLAAQRRLALLKVI